MESISTWSLILAITGPLIGGLIIFLSKSWSNTAEKRTTEHFKSIEKDCARLDGSLDKLENNLSESIKSLNDRYDTVRDRWEDKHDIFLEKYNKLDTTRDNKLNACFRSIDEIRTTIDDLRTAMFSKLDAACKDLEMQVRDHVKREVQERLDNAR